MEETFYENGMKRETNGEDGLSSVKRRRLVTRDSAHEQEKQCDSDGELRDSNDKSPTERVGGLASLENGAEYNMRRMSSTPIELLCRLFPTQKQSVLQLIYKGCNHDLIKTIECVLPSHEKAVASLKCSQTYAMNPTRCPQFAPRPPPPITPFPPFLPVPANVQHQRFYLPVSDSAIFTMHNNGYKRAYQLPSIAYPSKLDFTDEPSQRTCPRCQKEVLGTTRACDSCGHGFDAPPSPRG